MKRSDNQTAFRFIHIAAGFATSCLAAYWGTFSIPPNHFDSGLRILSVTAMSTIALAAIGYALGGKPTAFALGLFGMILGVWPIGFMVWLVFSGATP